MAKPAQKSGPVAWVYRDKIRMGWSPARLEQFKSMAAAGMNAVLPRHELDAVIEYDPAKAEVPQSENDAKIIKEIRDGSRFARQLGLRYFHCLNLAAASQTYTTGFQDNPARFNDGKLPSPVDPIYWKRTIVDRVRRVLDLLKDEKTYALDGIIIDPEMYALSDSLPGQPDYGRYAFETYLKEAKRTVPAAALNTIESRREWLEKQKLRDKFEKWQFDRIRGFGRDLEKLVHARRPNIILGYIIYENKMWFHAMAAGLSTPRMPVFIGPENTYSGVMDERMVTHLNNIRREVKVPALLVPGVMMGLEQGRVPEDFLKVVVGNVYQRSQISEGYWVYAIYNFGETPEQEKPFFGALKQINEALDEQAKTGRVANLQAAPLPIAKPAGFERLMVEARNWVPVAATIPAARRPDAGAKLRGSFTVLLWPKASEPASISLSAIQLGVYLDQCEATLIDSGGQLLWKDYIPFNRTTTLRVPETKGIVGGIIGAGSNAFEIQGTTCPMVIAPDDFLTLNVFHGFAGRFYFHVPANRTSFKITLQGHGTEVADYKIYDADNKVAFNVTALDETRTEEVKVTKPGVWCIEVDNVIDDAGFKLVDLPNLFALRPEYVMVQPQGTATP